MILRHLLRRQGHRSVQSTTNTFRHAQRCITTDVSSLEQSADTSIHNIKDIEALLNSVANDNIAPIAAELDHSPEGPSPTQLAADQFREFKRQEKLFKSLGADKTPHYEAHALVNNPPSPSDITLELLLSSQSHLGHSTSLWNPANAQYIFGIREGVHIISLDATAAYLRRACKIVEAVTAQGGLVLFAGTRPGQHRVVVKAAELSGGCHLFEKWIPGSLTNGQQILGRCQLKVVDEFDNEVPGFEDQLITQPTLKPDLVVCLNPLENYVLLHECALNNIPTIGIIDTDANPTWVTYPIPANDDSLRCISVIGGVLGRAGEAGKLHRLTLATQKQYSFQPAANLRTPGHLNTSSEKKYPQVLQLGRTVQDLEEQDRGIVHDYNIDVEPPEGAFDKELEGMKRQFLRGLGGKELERERKEAEKERRLMEASVKKFEALEADSEKAVEEREGSIVEGATAKELRAKLALRAKLGKALREKGVSHSKRDGDGNVKR